MFKLEFNADNAAFEDNFSHEFAYIYQGVMLDLFDMSTDMNSGDSCGGDCVDSNGNVVGTWEYSK